MNPGGEQNEGPRIDLGHDSGYSQPAPGSASTPADGPLAPAAPAKRGGSSALGLISLLVALAALGIGLWSVFNRPEAVPAPAPSPSVVPGATAERTAKLEKDVQDLMLRMVTLEKELNAVAKKTGAVSKLTQLSAKVAALQGRLDELALESRMAKLAKGGGASKAEQPKSKPAKPKAVEKEKTAEKPAAKPEKKSEAPQKSKPKKMTYTVRRGDSLFSIAVRYKVTVTQLKKWNNIQKGRDLQAGQKLVIYKNG